MPARPTRSYAASVAAPAFDISLGQLGRFLFVWHRPLLTTHTSFPPKFVIIDISFASMAQAVDAGVLALLKDVLAIAHKRGVRVTRAPEGTVTVSVYAPTQHTRRAAAAAKQSPPAAAKQSPPSRPSRSPPRGGTNSAARRKANRAAARAGTPLPFPLPAVTAAAVGNRLVPDAAKAPEARAEPAASTSSTTASASSTTTRSSAAANAAPAPPALGGVAAGAAVACICI